MGIIAAWGGCDVINIHGLIGDNHARGQVK